MYEHDKMYVTITAASRKVLEASRAGPPEHLAKFLPKQATGLVLAAHYAFAECLADAICEAFPQKDKAVVCRDLGIPDEALAAKNAIMTEREARENAQRTS